MHMNDTLDFLGRRGRWLSVLISLLNYAAVLLGKNSFILEKIPCKRKSSQCIEIPVLTENPT